MAILSPYIYIDKFGPKFHYFYDDYGDENNDFLPAGI